MKLLCIEIGYSRTIVCEVDNQTKRVSHMFVVPTPEGVLDDGMLQNADGFAADLRDALDERGIKTKQVTFTVSSNRIASRDVTIPYVKRSQIAEVVHTNESEYFPMDLRNYRVAYTILETLKEKEKEEEAEPKKKKKRARGKDESKLTGYRLSVLAIPKEMVSVYTAFAGQCGLELKDIDHNGNSLYQALRLECAEGVQALIKVNERRTQALILQDGNVVMSRFVPYGVDEAVAEVYDEGHLLSTASYDDAVRFLQTSPALSPAMTEAFGDLIAGILKVLELYESQNPARQIERIVLVGLGGTVEAFKNLLTAEIGMEVEVLADLEGFHIPREERSIELGEYVSCLGAFLSPANFFEEERAKKRAFGVELDDLTRLAMIILILLAIALVVTGVVGYFAQRSKNELLKSRLRNYTSSLSSYQEYTLSKQAAEYMQNAYDATQLPTSSLVAFIEELESKMPSDSIVTSFIADAERVTISMTARDKEEAADAIMQLRTFDSLEEVTVSGITDTASEVTSLGGGQVTFTIVGIYHGAQEEEADAINGAAQVPEEPVQAEDLLNP